MRVIRLYHPSINSTFVGQVIELSKEQTHHAVTVLRVKSGQFVALFDGYGSEFSGVIQQVEKRRVTIEIKESKHTVPNNLQIHLAIAVSKGERMDWVIQKATELGASEITPLISQRVDVKLSKERWAKKHNHWQKIIVNACEQCGQNNIPTLNPVMPLTLWLDQCKEDRKLIMDPKGNSILLQKNNDSESCALLVGPEGGFEDLEVTQAKQKGFNSWKLGDTILRTETAPIAGIAILQYSLGG